MSRTTVYRSISKRRTTVPRSTSSGAGLSTAYGRMLAKLATASAALSAARKRK